MPAIVMFRTVHGSYVKAVINIIHILNWKNITILYDREFNVAGKYTFKFITKLLEYEMYSVHLIT